MIQDLHKPCKNNKIRCLEHNCRYYDNNPANNLTFAGTKCRQIQIIESNSIRAKSSDLQKPI